MSEPHWVALGPDTQDAVRCVLSRALFDNRDLRLSVAYHVCLGLAAWGTAPLYWRGEERPPPWPEVSQGGYASGLAGMRKLALSRDDLAELWGDAERRWHEAAKLGDEILLTFVPRELWCVVASLLQDGPDRAIKRLKSAIDLAERQPVVKRNKARPDGGRLSASSIATRRSSVMRICNIAADLRAQGLASPVLAQWTHVPKRPSIKAATAVTDRTAPSRRQCRLVYAAYRDEVLRRFRCESLEALPARVEQLSDVQLEKTWAFFTLRTLAMLTVLLCTGSRRGALIRLRRRDFVPARPCWDGIARPALGVRPGKGKPVDDVYYKPIVHPAGCVIESWLTFVERMSSRKVLPDDPMFVPSLAATDRAANLDGITTLFSGCIDQKNPRKSRRAAFPRSAAAVSDLFERGPYSDEQCTGYSPHSLRHAADQLVEHGAPAYLASLGEHRINGSLIVKAMCNHSMSEDPFGYKDFSNPQGLE